MTRRLSLASLVFILLLAACGAATPAGTGQGGVIKRALVSEPPSLDPNGPAGSGQNVILPYIYDSLVYRDTDNTYKPFLAESWEIAPDGKAITFKLRPGLTFHDATPLNAEAVVFTYDRLRDKGSKSPLASGVATITAIDALDAQTVRFVFSQPTPTFLGTASMPYAGIVSPQAVQTQGAAFGQQPVGSGPFKLKEWQPGVSVTLAPNPDYRWAPAGLKQDSRPTATLVFKFIPDATTQLTALQAGEADIVFVNQPEHIARLQQDKNVRVVETPLNGLVYLGFNCQKAPYDDPLVRQALSYAINKDEIIQVALGGLGQHAFAPLASSLPGFDPSLKRYELGYDPARARALLAEAGFSQGADGAWRRGADKLGGVLLTSSRAPNDAVAILLQSQLKAVGVPVEIRQLDSSAATEASTKGQFDLLLWRYDWNDADVLNIYLSSANIGRTNRVFYSNPTLDDLLTKAGRTMDEKARADLYVEAQKVILTDAPWQPLYVPVDVTAIRTRVQGALIGPMGRMLLNDAHVAGK